MGKNLGRSKFEVAGGERPNGFDMVSNIVGVEPFIPRARCQKVDILRAADHLALLPIEPFEYCGEYWCI